jgi:hypothetical protein
LSGRGLCDELITRPEKSYRLCCIVVCDLETSGIGAPYIYDISHLRVNQGNIWYFSYRAIWCIQFLLTPRNAQFYIPRTDDITIDTRCSIQELVAAHWPPVALPTWPHADIPARLFRLPTILGTEGVCNPSVFCVPSVRRRRQESGVRYFSRFECNWTSSLREGGILTSPARPTTSQQRRAS